MICTLFTGQFSKEGIFMRYSYEFKLECIELYRQGKWPKTPEDVDEKWFHHAINEWYLLEENCGIDALRHKPSNRNWTPEEKNELVAIVLAGASRYDTAIKAGINPGLLYQWI